LKQKFIALLKRFRVSEELEHDQEEIGQKLSGTYINKQILIINKIECKKLMQMILRNIELKRSVILKGGDMEIEELFEELEDLSDSGPELDTMSVSSTPKPSLRPFFSSSRSLLAPPHSGKSHFCTLIKYVTRITYFIDSYLKLSQLLL